MTDQDTTPEVAPEQSLRDALAQAESTAQENWNKYLRAAAELDNVRKRAARDVEQARKFGIERLAADLLTALDSLEMGVEAGASASVDALLEGKRATLRQLKAALERHGVVEVSPAGQPFDPQLHEALSIHSDPRAEPGSVLEVVQKGYQLNGRLLRPARVIVAGPAGSPATDVEDEVS
jgi:molecular chaperone GrpE